MCAMAQMIRVLSNFAGQAGYTTFPLRRPPGPELPLVVPKFANEQVWSFFIGGVYLHVVP